MNRILPSLETLRFFEMAGRHGSFTLAASKLHVTPGAVSQRIKTLEDTLGVRLFERVGHEMVLTAKGRSLFGRVSPALKEIAGGLDSILPGRQPDVLTIGLLPAFASRWLLPRLPTFDPSGRAAEIRLKAESALASFEGDDVDIALRFGAGTWPGLRSEKLFDEVLFPVASPGLDIGAILERPPEIRNALLLRDEKLPWSIWFRHIGVPTDHPVRGMSFSDANLLLQAAAAGRGVALGRGALVADELAQGSLTRLSDTQAECAFGYYLVYRPTVMSEKISFFREWLLAQAQAFVSSRSQMVVRVADQLR
ncbi:LysR substrate-binding domain-containing protein [Tardiphaga sp. 42S5]|uniref:LysR substrate-binding domain-containing protein n=1 Tax=Tardiphaga sp. 42S5 TaxID=1404799 RepID=UPI002A59ABED|nr:LysR substrate-binding domain-containing protein [Tardiphaga sp. 42S5]WPO43958.1 LysR substrate-binding domain-containing protein [Tardiphaga sp. 42S5]